MITTHMTSQYLLNTERSLKAAQDSRSSPWPGTEVEGQWWTLSSQVFVVPAALEDGSVTRS
jgi:hypothetical protein